MQNQSNCHRKVRFVFLQTALFLLLIALCNCSQTTHEANSAIVIITKDAPESKNYSFSFTTMRVANKGNIVYVDTSLNLVHYRLKALPYDTITIYSNRDNFEVRHDYSASDCVYYLLNRGDTLLLSYPEKNQAYLPYAKIINRSYNENELNYDYLIAKQIPQPDSLPFRGAISYYSIKNDTLKEEAARKQFRGFLNKQSTYLDSLERNRFISETYYSYRKDNILSTIYLNALDSIPPNSLFLSDSVFLKYDSLIYFDFYRRLIYKVLSINYKSDTPEVQIQFDKIIYSHDYSIAVKKYVFRLLAKDLCIDLSNADALKRLTDYKNITGDSVIYFNLIEQFGLLQKDSIENTLNETPIVSKEKLMDAIVSRYKDKVVVVDFWGTWCQPCIEAIKKIDPLKQAMKNKAVVFVYITNPSSPKGLWEKRIQEISGEHYYLTKDEWESISSSKQYGFNVVPTYLLFDSSGALKNKITGYPGNEKMRAMIEKLLP